MQNRSDTWKELAARKSYRTESLAEIGGVTYASISAPIIKRALCSDALSVGNCVSATLSFSVLTQNEIPKSSEVIIRKRLVDGDLNSEWLPAGTFYISNRKKDPVTGLRTLQCYDAMLKTSTDYPVTEEDEHLYPKPMTDCILEIAAYIGVEVDDRTWAYIKTGADYVVQFPINLTVNRVLGYIGGVHGGNWIISPEGKLRFVPLLSGADAATAPDEKRIDVLGVLGKINVGSRITVSGVSISNGTDIFTAGDDSGYVVTVPANPYATQGIADDLLETIGGIVYQDFTLDKAVYDPAAELGDYIISKNDVASVLYAETASYNLAFRGSVSAPTEAEVEDEYPHIGNAALIDGLEGEIQQLSMVVANKASLDDLYAITAMIENLSVSDIKTGIIHSNDYEVIVRPYVYPQTDLYPAKTLYPSNGETVLKGFAIDFSTGTIYGAFYSDQIAELQKAVISLNESVDALRTALLYPKSPYDEIPMAYPGTSLFPSKRTYPIEDAD